MESRIRGRVWKFSDDVSTDDIHPPAYFSLDPVTIRRGAMKGIEGRFAEDVKPGDVIVAGTNFGCCSGRETAALSLKYCGVSLVMAESFGRLFFRNCINIGLPAMECPGITGMVKTGETLEANITTGDVVNVTTRREIRTTPLPDRLLAILEAGGLMETLGIAPTDEEVG